MDDQLAHCPSIARSPTSHHGSRSARSPARRPGGHDAVSASGGSPPDDGNPRTRRCVPDRRTPLTRGEATSWPHVWAGGPPWRRIARRPHSGICRELDAITSRSSCRGGERAQHDGLIVHESLLLERLRRDVVDGIPTTTIERTLFDLCSVVVPTSSSTSRSTARSAVELIDHGQLDRDRLDGSRRRGRAGTRHVPPRRWLGASRRSATPRARPNGSSLVRLVDQHGLPEPEVRSTRSVVDTDGRLVARVRPRVPAVARSSIEYDSYAQHLGRDAHDPRQRTTERDRRRWASPRSLRPSTICATAGIVSRSVIRQIRDRAA